MFTSQMMKEVHRIAANLEGDYSARLVLAFREVLKADEIVLEGTEKQVTWALDLRVKMLAMLLEELELNYFNRVNEQRKAMLTVLIEELSEVKTAVFFIDNRNVKQNEIVNTLLAAFDFNNRKAEIIEKSKKFI
mgnify:FL=1